MIKAVVFDLDHTLFDRHATLRALVPDFRRRFDTASDMSDEKLLSLWCCGDDSLVYHGWERVWSFLIENGVFNSPPEFSEYSDFLSYSFGHTAVAFPETVPMLMSLREAGYKTAMITNGYHDLQYSKIDMLGLRDCFDEIMVSGDYEVFKPDRRIFDIMREKLGLRPEEIVYVGDNPVNDILGAHSAGWKAIWIQSTGYWDDSVERADGEVGFVTEIPDMIEKFNLTEE